MSDDLSFPASWKQPEPKLEPDPIMRCKHGSPTPHYYGPVADHHCPGPDFVVTPDQVPTRTNRVGDSQPLPTPNDRIDTQALAIAMIHRRRDLGVKRYGTALQPDNGRDSLWDAVEESLDMFTYLLNYWREQHPGEELPS